MLCKIWYNILSHYFSFATIVAIRSANNIGGYMYFNSNNFDPYYDYSDYLLLSYLNGFLGKDAVQAFLDYLNGDSADARVVTVVDNCLWTMKKYIPENPWWWRSTNGNNLAYMAYFQLQESVLLVPFEKFLKGLEELLGRDVQYLEISMNPDLRDEAEKAFEKLADK